MRIEPQSLFGATSLVALIGFLTARMSVVDEHLVGAGTGVAVAFLCLGACVLLAIASLTMFRLRGAWAILPVAVAAYWPWVFFSISAACAANRAMCP